jgi:hypothetical protein
MTHKEYGYSDSICREYDREVRYTVLHDESKECEWPPSTGALEAIVKECAVKC